MSATKKQTPKPPKKTVAEKLGEIGIDAICEMVADCKTLQTIANMAGVSKSKLSEWLDNNHSEQYARARLAQADKLVDDLMAIVDEPPMLTASGSVDAGDVAHKRLRMDARKWLAGKMNSKKYGDKVTNEITGENGDPIKTSLTVTFVDPE